MTSKLYSIVPAALGVAALTLFAGCTESSSDSGATTTAAQTTPAEIAEADAEENAPTIRQRDTETTDPGQTLAATADAARSAVERGAQRPARNPDAQPIDPNAPHLVKVEPEMLDLGEMATRETKKGTVRLVNTGDKPMTITDSRTSCGCTVANVPKGQELEPGESVEVEVSLRASAREETISKTVTFIVEGQPPLTLRVQGTARAFVTMEPDVLNRDTDESRVVIRAADDQPFSIKSMHPQLVENLPEEPATEHTLDFTWERWEELGSSPRLLVYIDHPKSQQLMGSIRATRSTESIEPSELAERLADRSRNAQPSTRDLASLVDRGTIDEVRTRLEEGGDVNATDRSGMNLLGIAAKKGNVEMMQLLIDSGADVNGIDRIGRTPLMAAAQSKNVQAVRLLIQAGADVDARDNTIGNSALAWAAGFGDAASVRELLDAGARVEVVSQATGFTPLIWAAGFGDTEAVRMLVEAGADIEATDYAEGATPLMHATRTGRADNVRALIDAGADLDAVDATGRTPLLWAAGASGAGADTVQVLIDAGANLSAKDKRDWTALDHAKARTDARAEEVVALLESKMGSSD